MGNESLIIAPTETLQPYFHYSIATKNSQGRFPIIRYDDYNNLNKIVEDYSIGYY
ncbi:hypothetical protein ACN4EE_00125 [Geminocystis sp. CENA526]|uniref:hypothetical protein n=1 Tax=Geminocystis sp. CENA526 TaxID=1355871 RepID=UPI003D6FC0AF